VEESVRTSRSSLALDHLRAIAILIVVAVHAFLAYLGSAKSSAFDRPPYTWRAVPLVDHARWFGFDIFAASADVYLMVLLFFLSALFTAPSLSRKGARNFLRERTLRLGLPWAFGVFVLMPLALYPVYRTRSGDPGVLAYLRHLLALPFFDNGPMWFLWQLLVLTVIAALLCRFAPRAIEVLSRLAANAGSRPFRYFIGLTAAAVLAYVPLALVFTPMAWAARGPFSLQFCRPLLYLVFYLAGLGVGARGFDKGLLASDSALEGSWARWLFGACIVFFVWLALMAVSVETRESPLALELALDVSFALAATSGCFAALALGLRFASTPSPVLAAVSKNAFGLYIVHYPIAVWLQYAFLGIALFVFAKAAIVLALTLILSFAAISLIRAIPFGSRLLGEAAAQPAPMAGELPRRAFV